jgi:nicotinate-nucleotide adenylyltransferase
VSEADTRTVGVFGGSFNPPHVGHLLAVTYVLATEPVDLALVVPCYDHPFGKSLAPFAHRKAMCEAAFRDLARVEVSSIEQEMGATSRTLYTLRALTQRNPGWKLRLIIGADILHEKDKWFGWDEIERLAPPVVLGRIGFPHDDAPVPVIPEVASRDVRAMLTRGDDVSAMVPRAVLEYARANGLYAPG